MSQNTAPPPRPFQAAYSCVPALPEQVLKYLARYTHRVAISNRRILDVSDSQVAISWRDDAYGDQVKRLRLSAGEFLRRFLQHVLPQDFVRTFN